MDDIYAVVKRYAVGGDDSTFDDWIYKPSNYNRIYDKIMELTDGDHEISDDAASWCEDATVGEIYEFREGEIEIMEIN